MEKPKPGHCEFCGEHIGRGIAFHRKLCTENPDARQDEVREAPAVPDQGAGAKDDVGANADRPKGENGKEPEVVQGHERPRPDVVDEVSPFPQKYPKVASDEEVLEAMRYLIAKGIGLKPREDGSKYGVPKASRISSLCGKYVSATRRDALLVKLGHVEILSSEIAEPAETEMRHNRPRARTV